MGSELVAWKRGPVLRPLSLWLDVPPVGRGLRFISSVMANPGRRSDRGLATLLTGRYHFGPEHPFLTANFGEEIHLGAGVVRLLPSGLAPDAALLHFQGPRGSLLFCPGLDFSGGPLSQAGTPEPAEVLLLDCGQVAGGEVPSLGVQLRRVLRTLDQVDREEEVQVEVPAVWTAGEVGRLLVSSGREVQVNAAAKLRTRWLEAGGFLPRGDRPGLQVLVDPRLDPGRIRLVSGGEVLFDQSRATGLRLSDLTELVNRVAPLEVVLYGAGSGIIVEALRSTGVRVRILAGERQLSLW